MTEVARHQISPIARVRRRGRATVPSRILVVKLADLGDVLTTTPALRALRQTFPQAQLDALVTPRSAAGLKGSTLVDEVITFNKFAFDQPMDAFRPANIQDALHLAGALRRRQYDTVVLLHHLNTAWGRWKYFALLTATGAKRRVGLNNGRGWFLTASAPDLGFGARHEVEYWLEVAGVLEAHTEDTRLDVPIGEDDRAYAQRLLQSTSPWGSSSGPLKTMEGPLVVIHPGSGGYSLARRWDAAGFAAVGDMLVERLQARLAIVGTAMDGGEEVVSGLRNPALDLTSRTTVGQLAAVLEQAALFLGADSGVVHVAAATGTPMVTLYGPTNQRAWGPWCPNSPAVVLRSAPLCSPCAYVGYSVGRHNGCAERTCMRMIRPEQVAAVAERVLTGQITPSR